MTYSFHLTCPYDGADVEHVAAGTTNGWETRGVARCTDCHTTLLVALTVQPAATATSRALRRKASVT